MTKSLSTYLLVAVILPMSISATSIAGTQNYKFDGSMSRAILENYLSRAVTHAGLCSSSPEPSTANLDDAIRMLTEIGARFVGRAAFAWHLPKDDEQHFKQV